MHACDVIDAFECFWDNRIHRTGPCIDIFAGVCCVSFFLLHAWFDYYVLLNLQDCEDYIEWRELEVMVPQRHLRLLNGDTMYGGCISIIWIRLHLIRSIGGLGLLLY